MVASPAATRGHPAPYVQQQFGCLIFIEYAASESVVCQVSGHQVYTGLRIATAASTASPFVNQQPFMQLHGQSITPAMQMLPMQSELLHQAASKHVCPSQQLASGQL